MRSGTRIRAWSRQSASKSRSLSHVSNLYRIPEAERLADAAVQGELCRLRVLLQLRRRGDGGRDQDRAQVSGGERQAGTVPHCHIRGRLPWPHAGDARRRRTEEVSRRLRSRRSTASIRLPFGDLEAVRKAIGPDTGAILIEPIMGEGGVRVVAPEFLKGAAPDLRPARAAADVRRGADRHGPLRRAVRLSAHRRHPRHHGAGQGAGRRISDGRGARHRRGRQGHDRGHPRFHLRRQPAGDGGRQCRARRHAGRRLLRPGQADVARRSSRSSPPSRIAIRP